MENSSLAGQSDKPVGESVRQIETGGIEYLANV